MADRADVLRLWAAFALLGAGLVHLAVVREHLGESLAHGLFFAVAGTAQVAWAVAAMARTRVPAPRSLVTAQLGLLVLWAASRSTGLPVPPDPWTPEPAGTADLVTVALEVVVIAAVVLAVRDLRHARGPVRSMRPGRLLLGAGAGALVVSALTTPALAATEAGDHAHPHGESHALAAPRTPSTS